MAQQHSEQKGSRPLISYADYYTEVNDAGEVRGVTRMMLDIPRDFDLSKRGAELLRQIESARNLFHGEQQ